MSEGGKQILSINHFVFSRCSFAKILVGTSSR
jgi:hypothetical protein